MDYLCNCKSEISNVCNVMEVHCLQVLKIVYHYANSCFDWLISGQQSVNPSREAISILSGKYKGFTFVQHMAFSSKVIILFVPRAVLACAVVLLTSWNLLEFKLL